MTIERKLANRIDITGKSINEPKKIWKNNCSPSLKMFNNNDLFGNKWFY